MKTETKQDPVIVAELVTRLSGDFGERAVTTHAVREHHSHGEGLADAALPDVVVFPHSNEEVASIVRLCHLARVPVIAFGVGTSLEGHVAALYGGVSVDLSQMNRLLEVNAEDLDCRVQAGVTREQLNTELKGTGLFFPIDPGANATIGGMSATRASGTNAVRYGTMRENVLGLTVVTANGEVVHTGTRAKKSSAGYDLTRLMVGSEGTLGVMTEITLRLYPQPEAISAAVCSFPSIAAAVHTTMQIIQMGGPIARCELLDTNAVRAVNRHDKLSLREGAMLLMEFHGTEASVAEQIATVEQIAGEQGGEAFEWASTPEERTRLWTARHHAYFAGLQMKPGCRTVTTDTCVPISRLADCLLDTVAEVDASGLAYYIVGHVGDGNFHVAYLVYPAIPTERETAEQLNLQLVQRALSLDGTCTGEHGIGLHKMGFLLDEAGAGAVEMMRTIKQPVHPKN